MESADPSVFHVVPRGGLGSRMLQLMVALRFRDLAPGCAISNVDLPEWGIAFPAVEGGGAEEALGGDRIDLPGLAGRMLAGEVRRIAFSGLGRRLENLLAASEYREVFRSPFPGRVGFGEGELVCHVPGGAGQPLTPVEFYADLVAETGLRPVFTGRTGPDLYTDRLRARFPDAMFVEPRDPALDFETIRQSRNVVVGASMFAWLAAWLSGEARVFMAVYGQFNPMQERDAAMLPLDDPRYRFYLFPVSFAAPPEAHAEAHGRIAGCWRHVPSPILTRLLSEAPRFERTLDAMTAHFDPAFYLSENPDVARALGPDNFDGARAHYADFGFRERRAPFRLDEAWYAARHPMAALEVAQGDYADFAHHYVAVGRERGYRPFA